MVVVLHTYSGRDGKEGERLRQEGERAGVEITTDPSQLSSASALLLAFFPFPFLAGSVGEAEAYSLLPDLVNLCQTAIAAGVKVVMWRVDSAIEAEVERAEPSSVHVRRCVERLLSFFRFQRRVEALLPIDAKTVGVGIPVGRLSGMHQLFGCLPPPSSMLSSSSSSSSSPLSSPPSSPPSSPSSSRHAGKRGREERGEERGEEKEKEKGGERKGEEGEGEEEEEEKKGRGEKKGRKNRMEAVASMLEVEKDVLSVFALPVSLPFSHLSSLFSSSLFPSPPSPSPLYLPLFTAVRDEEEGVGGGGEDRGCATSRWAGAKRGRGGRGGEGEKERREKRARVDAFAATCFPYPPSTHTGSEGSTKRGEGGEGKDKKSGGGEVVSSPSRPLSFSPSSHTHKRRKSHLDSFTPRRILLTGGAGFIGSHVCNYLVHTYPECTVVNFDLLDYCSSLRNVQACAGRRNYTFVKGDIRNLPLVEYVMTSMEVDTVLHFAAQSHVDVSFANSIEFTTTNVVGTHVLLEASRRVGVKRFVHVSTDEVYGDMSHDAADAGEGSLLDPTNPYASSKAAAEFIVKSYSRSYNLPVIISRGNNVYGPAQFPEKVIPKFVLRLLRGEKCCVHGRGTAKRSYVYVDDVVRAFDLILHRGEPGHTYNIGSASEVPILHLARSLISLIRGVTAEKEQDAYIEYVEDRRINDRRYAVDGSKLTSLGWSQLVSFHDGLRHTVEWYRNLEGGYWKNVDASLT
eukprot:CAMPEP_0113906668 /NCGR_PEP_ID=MMETSP0780_2-20120614/24924_1 /TAXON_ID=652834 /ORGANISM="Palpitomonas bilix" /LENGTH=740 /DNA_ID=CAMNT_0000901391 /DNA_START=118 /DNA_END=2335 /DNA_ORIENTATION=+ /assembly_acc=CAM_ASM_000599